LSDWLGGILGQIIHGSLFNFCQKALEMFNEEGGYLWRECGYNFEGFFFNQENRIAFSNLKNNCQQT